MTINIGETVFSGIGRFCRMGAAVILLAIAGCSSTNTEGTAPAASLVEGPKDTGAYPNLNIPPQVAAEQFTEEEKSAKLAQLKADGQAQGSRGGAVRAANTAALNTLARKHGADALKQIETNCDPALDPTCK